MKKHLLTLTISFALLSAYLVNAQSYNYEDELAKMVKVPNTPEAEAFAKYGNTDVNMYTGTPNISIPLYTIVGNELSLPISLSYDASGVKVSQLATGVGLSWNLNVGGRISRAINGLPDDYLTVSGSDYTSVYNNVNDVILPEGLTNKTLKELIEDNLNPPSQFLSASDADKYFGFLKAIGESKLDTQPDYFSFNALGISDHFVYDMESSTFVALDNPRIKATATLSGGTYKHIISWIITNDDGTKFYFNYNDTTGYQFNDVEKTKTIGPDISSNPNYVQEYYSSWLLTKIESPNKADVYEFEYNNFSGALIEDQPLIRTSSISNDLNHPTDPDSAGAKNETINYTEYQQTQLALTTIKHNGKAVIDIDLKSRSDYDASNGIDKIDIRNYADNGIIKSYKLYHSYFGAYVANDYDRRLKLDSIQIKSSSNRLSSYAFEYFSPASVPTRASLSRDYLEYFNGKSNTKLYPAVSVSGTSFAGADRSPDFDKAIYGTLKKITYPTGGYTEFLFEPNKTTYTAQDISSSVQDVTHGNLSVTANSGSTYSNNGCGTCCIDKYGSNPNINGVVFTITDPDNYDIEFTNDAGSSGEAYLFKRTDAIKPYATVMPYDDVIKQETPNACDILVEEDLDWTNLFNNDNDPVYLSVGTYQITLVKGKPQSGSVTISLRVHRSEITNNNTVNTGEVTRAGIRIKSIKDYSASSVLSTEKEYIYKTEINGSDSSGNILFNPTYYTLHDYTIWSQENNASLGLVIGENTRSELRRGSSWSGGYRPHVGYSTVFERQKATGEENGFVKHVFNASPYVGAFSTGVSPNVNLYKNEISAGKEVSSTVYQDIPNSFNTEIVSKQTTGFEDNIHFGNTTLYVYNDPTKNYQFIRIFKVATNNYQYEILYPNISGFLGPYGPGTMLTATAPASCSFTDSHCLTLAYSTFKTNLTYAQGRVGGVTSTTNKQFFAGDSITTIKRNTYDSSLDYLLRESKTYTSERGSSPVVYDSLTTKYYYTKDYDGNTVYDDMIDENMLTNVIKTEAYKNTSKLAAIETGYSEWSTNVFKPDTIRSAKGTLGFEDRMIVHSYDSKGNPREVSQADGMHTVYIWGYNKQHIVAKVENAAVSQVEALSGFSSGLTINEGLNTTQENSLLNMSNAMVTIYRYNDPRIGVSSIIDPNGYVTTYEYDEFNRLVRVKDDDGKILSENAYHYKY